MHELGYSILLLTLVVAVFSATASVVGFRRKLPRLEQAGYIAAFATTALITLTAFILIYLFTSQDFGVKYVQHYSDRSMPVLYVISAMWGGQDGSLLFWLWVLSLYSAVALWWNRKQSRLVPYATAVLMTTAAFFVVLLLFAANPFETFIGVAPTDGEGLNPLLQNAYMAIHPPMLYLGYIGMVVPFSFGIAALASGQLDETWLRISRRWTLTAWFFLSIGLVLGMLWAYEELGWGGYWAWDPVENAGFLPWLTCTAFLHSIMIQERRGMFKMWNMILVIHSFAFTLLGTFLTRSGVVQSVHAFAQSSVGPFFTTFLGFSLLVSFALLVYRRKELVSTDSIESMASREFSFLLNNWILLGMAYFMLIATVFPALSDYFMGQKVTVGPPFYNKWMVPLGLVLLFLCGVGPLIAWRKASKISLRKQFLWPGVQGLVFGLVSIPLGALEGGFAPVVTYALCGFVTGTIGQEYTRGIRMRMKNTGEGFVDALMGLMSRAKRRYGGYVIHFGVVLMFLGWAGNAYKSERDVSLARGERATIGKYEVRYDDLLQAQDSHTDQTTAVISVFNTAGGLISTQYPAKWMYKKSQQPTTEVSIRTGVFDDLYLILAGFDARDGSVALRLIVNPFVVWVWIGAGFLVLGMGIVMWPDRYRKRHLGSGRGLASLLLLVGLSAGLGVPTRALAVGEKSFTLPPALELTAKELDTETVCLCGGCSRLQNSVCTCGWTANIREEFRGKLKAGETKQQILDEYVKKFGQEILAAPPDRGFNRLAWALPYGALSLGALGLFIAGRRWSKRSAHGPSAEEDLKAEAALSENQTQAEAEAEVALRDRLNDALDDLD